REGPKASRARVHADLRGVRLTESFGPAGCNRTGPRDHPTNSEKKMTDSTPQVNHPIQRVFDGHQIRVIVDESGDPWFIGADVARALGYSNTRAALAKHCKGVAKRDIPTNSGVQQMALIPERDLYRLILRSNLPSAERFEEWVVDEVLPSIRRT